MECISELKDSLNVYFGWNKARMACFVTMLLAWLATRTVNLNKLACVVFGDALQTSRYRRIQRFFSKFHHLVYYEIHSDVYEAITREKRIKKWNRQWKINLIEQNNPQWLDFAIGLF